MSNTNLRKIIIITMEVVRLSRMADRKKVIKAIFHNNERLLLVLIRDCTQLKPPF